jgi:hypothetical protein
MIINVVVVVKKTKVMIMMVVVEKTKVIIMKVVVAVK